MVSRVGEGKSGPLNWLTVVAIEKIIELNGVCAKGQLTDYIKYMDISLASCVESNLQSTQREKFKL